MKRIIISVTNDLVTDQRVNKTCLTLSNAGYDILLVGRVLKKSLPLANKPYQMHRMRLLFTKGPFFYIEFNLRLFFFLLSHRADIFFSNDLDTLLPNYVASKIKGKPLVYDTHEYFCYAPELVNRPKVQNIWLSIEKYIFPKLKWVFTVNDSIAALYKGHYKIEPFVVRNVPMKQVFAEITLKSRKDLGLPLDKAIIVLQGSGINVNRGAEEALLAMQWIDNAVFLIIGSGDVLEKLKKMAKDYHLEQKILFKPKMPFEEMIRYTSCADIGLTIDKADNPNYEFSLPNKLFDYIHAGIPVLASPLTEIYKVFNKYPVGLMIENHDPKHIAEKINDMLSDQERIQIWKKNTLTASVEYNWECESAKIISVISAVGSNE